MPLKTRNTRHRHRVGITHPLPETLVLLRTTESTISASPTKGSHSTYNRPATSPIPTSTTKQAPTAHTPPTPSSRNPRTSARTQTQASPTPAAPNPAPRAISTPAATPGCATRAQRPHPARFTRATYPQAPLTRATRPQLPLPHRQCCTRPPSLTSRTKQTLSSAPLSQSRRRPRRKMHGDTPPRPFPPHRHNNIPSHHHLHALTPTPTRSRTPPTPLPNPTTSPPPPRTPALPPPPPPSPPAPHSATLFPRYGRMCRQAVGAGGA